MASSKVGEDGQRWQMMNDSGCGWRDQKPRLGGVLLYGPTAKAAGKTGYPGRASGDVGKIGNQFYTDAIRVGVY
ncbi:hypothetical protein HBJ00_14430 [Aeromonas veronii]|uniref:hypothetical protein n=1 Tax=Aeromonas TaxID=642 RepID=UPI0014310ABD|nr:MULTISPECIES: hypothetical protein [Aeromonas]EKP0313579.1 hypothetical protein [Aeromonas veronii]NJI19870.1 hypothetical protein [Aeromonas veronii]